MELKEQPDTNILAFEKSTRLPLIREKHSFSLLRELAWTTPKHEQADLPGFIYRLRAETKTEVDDVSEPS